MKLLRPSRKPPSSHKPIEAEKKAEKREAEKKEAEKQDACDGNHVHSSLQPPVNDDYPHNDESEKHKETFYEKLLGELEESAFGGLFLPESSLSNLFHNSDTNFNIILPGASSILLDFIRSESRKIFLITLMSTDYFGSDLVAVMESFQKHRLTDNALPISNIRRDKKCDWSERHHGTCDHDRIFNSFHIKQWNLRGIQEFYTKQWQLIAPVFNKDNIAQLRNELPPDTIMPFTDKSETKYEGHFSEVCRATLRADHQDKLVVIGDGKKVHVALKRLKSTLVGEADYNVEAAWMREADVLNHLSEFDHRHLIRGIAAFRWRKEYYILFEWADGGTLREFWSNNKDVHLALTSDRIIEVLTQLCGISDALLKLHSNHRPPTPTTRGPKDSGFTTTEPYQSNASVHTRYGTSSSGSLASGDESKTTASLPIPIINIPDGDHETSSRHWRHGDIKPENLLLARTNRLWLGTLKIADLGLAKQHDFVTAQRREITNTRHTTFHYEAPEAVTQKGGSRSRRYDIWSMGCIILESVIWLLYGMNGLNQFYPEKDDAPTPIPDTFYFSTKAGDGSNLIASVSENVKSWMDAMLTNDPELNSEPTALTRLVKLVRDQLLVVDVPGSPLASSNTKYRADASELCKELRDILRKAKGNRKFAFTGKSRAQVPIPIVPSKSAKSDRRSSLIPGQGKDLLSVNNTPASRSAQQTMNTYRHVELKSDWDFQNDDLFFTRITETPAFGVASRFPGGSASLCMRCLSLDLSGSGFIGVEDSRHLRSRAKECELCNFILDKYSHSSTPGASGNGSIELWMVQGGLALRPGATPILSIYSIPSPLTGPKAQTQHILKGLPLLAPMGDQSYFEFLHQWIEDCDENHPGCHPTKQEAAFFRVPTRLIDVMEKDTPEVRLIETREWALSHEHSTKYIALSHPWGSQVTQSFYWTTQQNLVRHKAGICVDILPKTLKDAVRVTRELGIQYIWIDSLCIIQGEDGDFSNEAKHMESVFSSAYCVIAATCAKGMSDGFLKPRPERRVVKVEGPRSLPFYACEFIDDFQHDVIDGQLNQRGWVLQERALARRTLYFAENQTYWECGAGIRCETLAKMKNNQAALLGDPKFPKVATDSTKGGRIRLYELLYKQYSRLQFTNAHDRPLAIAGLEQRLIRAFETQGGYGVFVRYFGRSLLWQRDVDINNNFNDITTSTTNGTPPSTAIMRPINFPKSSRIYRVPSWSWMAYEGAISFLDMPFGEIDWEEKEVRSPWNPSTSPMIPSSPLLCVNETSRSGWHTADTDGRIDLTVIARNFSASADAGVVYDRGERPAGCVVKCVIVGRKKGASNSAARQLCYVLVIAQKQGGASASTYERVGVGSMLGSAIDLKESGILVHVF